MKFLVLYCFCASFVMVPVYSLTVEQDRILDNLELVCINKTRVSQEDVEKVNAGDWTLESKQMREYMLCLLSVLGLMTPEGEFLMDEAMQRVPERDRAELIMLHQACYHLNGPDAAHTAWNYMKCYHSKNPKHRLLIAHSGYKINLAEQTTESLYTKIDYIEADAWDWIGHKELNLDIEEDKALHDHQFSCINESEVLSEDLKKLYGGNWETDNPHVRAYVICILNELKFLSPEGEFLIDEALKRIPEEDQSAMKNIHEGCNKTTGSNAPDITWTYMKCYHSKNPKYFLLSLLPYRYHKPSSESPFQDVTITSTREFGPWDWIGQEEEHLTILNGNTETPVDP